jgi:hypothetical protein
MRTETDPFSEILCFLVSGIRDDGKSKKTVILSVVYHGQNPVESVFFSCTVRMFGSGIKRTTYFILILNIFMWLFNEIKEKIFRLRSDNLQSK